MFLVPLGWTKVKTEIRRLSRRFFWRAFVGCKKTLFWDPKSKKRFWSFFFALAITVHMQFILHMASQGCQPISSFHPLSLHHSQKAAFLKKSALSEKILNTIQVLSNPMCKTAQPHIFRWFFFAFSASVLFAHLVVFFLHAISDNTWREQISGFSAISENPRNKFPPVFKRVRQDKGNPRKVVCLKILVSQDRGNQWGGFLYQGWLLIWELGLYDYENPSFQRTFRLKAGVAGWRKHFITCQNFPQMSVLRSGFVRKLFFFLQVVLPCGPASFSSTSCGSAASFLSLSCVSRCLMFPLHGWSTEIAWRAK